MRRALAWTLLITCGLSSVSIAKQGGTPDSRAARAAAREWLQRNPEFAAKTGNAPGSTAVKHHDHAVVLVDSWPAGPLQGVIRLTGFKGAWRVISARIRPHPKDLLGIHFHFVLGANGKARHITLTRCTDHKRHREVPGALTAPEKARGIAFIASHEYHPNPEVIGTTWWDVLLFDPHTRKYLDNWGLTDR